MGATNVPAPTWGPNGIVLPSEANILAGVQADWLAAIPNLTFGTQQGSQTNPTPQGQIVASETAIIGDANAFLLWVFQQFDPALSSGRAQDALGRIYFLTRIPGAPTIQPCLITGLVNVPIPVGALAIDQSQNLWICQQAGTIPSSGNITLNFAAAVDGPTPAPTTLAPYKAIFGWDTIAPSGDAVLGQNVETAAQFETRRSQSTAINSMGPADAILGAVLAVSGVLDAYVYDNASPNSNTVGGVTLQPNSIYACVLGGTTAAVAMAIWSKKAPGCAYTGSTVVTVNDPNPLYAPPGPAYLVAYQLPTLTAFAVRVLIVNSSAVPANALTQIQGAIVAAFAGLDGNPAGSNGPRARIGSNVLASRYYAPVMQLGTWAASGALLEIKVGISGAACSFTGSISGTALTVGSVASGALAIGQMLQDTTGVLMPGTLITAGSGTSWTVSVSQTVASESMTATAIGDSVQMNIDQAPTVSATNIVLVLQ